MQNNYPLFVESQSIIPLGKNPTFYSWSKHIYVSYHWVHDALDAKLFELDKVHNDEYGIDMMTKELSRWKLETCYEIAALMVTSM